MWMSIVLATEFTVRTLQGLPSVADVAIVDHQPPAAHVLLHQACRVERRTLLAKAVLVRAVDLGLHNGAMCP